jgi:hypothetical protein
VAHIQQVPLHCLHLLGEGRVLSTLLLLLLLLLALEFLQAALQLDALKVADLQEKGQPRGGVQAAGAGCG